MKTMRTLTYFVRNEAPHAATYRPDATLPPRETFADHPDILDVYDEFVRLQEAMRSNARTSLAKRSAAQEAERTYQTDVANALRDGEDPAKVKQNAPRLYAEAKAHDGFSTDARAHLTSTGQRLGAAIQQAGASLFPASEEQMAEAARDIEAAVDTLTQLWATWGEAWGLRLHLSNVTHSGGSGLNYQASRIPPKVLEGLAAVSATLTDLATLQHDEGQINAWREEQAQARAYNERAFGGSR